MSKRDPSEVAHRVAVRYRDEMARQGREVTQTQAHETVGKMLTRNDNKKTSKG